MKKCAVFVALWAAWSFTYAAAPMQAGLWEVRPTKQVVDGKDMTAQMAAAQAQMQEQLAKMSPAQREQMQKMMGGQKLPTGGAQRMCISAEMAAQDKPAMPPDAQCEPVKFQRSGNKTTFEINCTANGNTTVGTGESVTNGDTVTSRMDMTISNAQGRHTMQTESQMKYLGADCQGVKPMDQLLKELKAAKKP
jgi:hypothetical protein